MKTKKITLRITTVIALITFIIYSCKKEDSKPTDPCSKITCLNGGTCVNGSCSCPQGYSGADCGTQVTPTKIKVTKVEVIRMPSTDAGAGWDLTSGPDIYPKITFGSTVIWDSPNYIQDANPSVNHTFTPSTAFELTSPTSQYTITLYDYDDLDTDDWMGGINFTPYSSSNKFPSVLTLDAGGAVAFKLHLTYVW